MNLELKKASITEKPILANLLELYAYDFTEHCDFDIGDDGFYGYKNLPLYWTDSDKFSLLDLLRWQDSWICVDPENVVYFRK